MLQAAAVSGADRPDWLKHERFDQSYAEKRTLRDLIQIAACGAGIGGLKQSESSNGRTTHLLCSSISSSRPKRTKSEGDKCKVDPDADASKDTAAARVFQDISNKYNVSSLNGTNSPLPDQVLAPDCSFKLPFKLSDREWRVNAVLTADDGVLQSLTKLTCQQLAVELRANAQPCGETSKRAMIEKCWFGRKYGALQHCECKGFMYQQ